MCGRFVQLCDPESYAEAFEVEALPLCPPRYNLAPSQPLLAIRRGTGAGREAVLLRWGLVPGWSKGPDPHFSMINARAETVHLKPGR